MLKLRMILMSALTILFVVGIAVAQAQQTVPGPAGVPPAGTEPAVGTFSWVFPALGSFAVGIAALGAALGDGRAIAAACEGTARNPGAGGRIFTMLILGLALIETLVLFTFLTVLLKG